MAHLLFRLGLPAALLLAGCSGEVVLASSGGAGGTGSQTTTNTGSSTSTKNPDECPPAAPAPAAPCSDGLTCTYGTPQCEQTFLCNKGKWTALAIECAGSCPPNAPVSGTPCTGNQQCDYPDPSCSAAGTEATCSGGAWIVSSFGPACAPSCPFSPPSDGQACDSCCNGPCTYPLEPGCSVSAECLGNKWVTTVPPCVPPAPCFTYTDPMSCQGDFQCRWLVPSCGGPLSLPEAGCYSKVQCEKNIDCEPDEVCSQVSVDPCWNSPCNACSGTTTICTFPPPP